MANKPKKEKFFGFSFYALFHEIFTLSVAKFMQFFNAFPKSGFFGAYRAVENQQNVGFALRNQSQPFQLPRLLLFANHEVNPHRLDA